MKPFNLLLAISLLVSGNLRHAQAQCTTAAPLSISPDKGVTSICPGQSLQLIVIGTPPGSVQIWKKDGAPYKKCACGLINVTETGTYSVANELNGCASAEVSLTITTASNCGTTGGGSGGNSGGNGNGGGSGSGNGGSNSGGSNSGGNGNGSGNSGSSGSGSGTSGSGTSGSSTGGSAAPVNPNNLGAYVGINVSNTGQTYGNNTGGPYSLAVNGKILAQEMRVRTGWADYVFDATYRLRSLAEVESYIHAHGHLPGVPSAAKVQAEGIQVGETHALLLSKIEELTLYVIQQQKEIEALKKKLKKK
jgi:hypothetical protein